jgi:predicted amidohydrolase
LEKCKKEDVHIVVFPELSIDKELRDLISKWLKEKNTKKTIIMVTAGSYHMHDKKRNRYENRSIVLRFDGVPLWEQKKLNKVKLDENDIKGFLKSKKRGLKKFQKLFNENDKKGWEDIKISDTLLIRDSSIGRMAVTICLDFFVREKMELLIAPNINLIFAPSMSPTLKKFIDSNPDLGTYARASVFCANSCWVITGGECEGDEIKQEHSSYIYIPMKKGRVHMNCFSKCDCLNCNLLAFRVSEIQEFLEKNKKKIDRNQNSC